LDRNVSRETLDLLGSRFCLQVEQLDALQRLLSELAAEPDPPTTVTSGQQAVDHHIADALVALELPSLCAAQTVVDIGSGAGFPGLVLGVALADARLDLVESSERSCQVMQRLSDAASLENVRVICRRAEEWADLSRESYDVATARAVGPLAVVVEYAAPLIRLGGSLVVWRGKRDSAQEHAGDSAARKLGLCLEQIRAVSPFAGARNRHLHVYKKAQPTPAGFPRRPGIASKRPLA
jgi:16S rRNA (guanine527-N7)-methyltransferase